MADDTTGAVVGTRRRPLISFVLCSRNDQFQGDSLWRLGTSLNVLARTLQELDRLDDAEVVVSDWGSAEPLRDATVLTDEARRIVRFLTVPPELAKAKQRDSPFAEVIAINAAARRSTGEYVGRIDQDTVVGREFLEWFFDTVDPRPVAQGGHGGRLAAARNPEGFRPETTAMIANRRRVPYHLAVRTPALPLIERYVDTFGSRLPRMDDGPEDRYWEIYIGIIVFHRDLWEACEGYDETFLYYGYMEFDLFLRLLMKYEGAEISRRVGTSFFHLDHVPAWSVGAKLARKTNVARRPDSDPPTEMRPNGPDWGLAAYDLPLEPSTRPAGSAAANRRWHRGDGRTLAALTAASTARTAVQIAYEAARRTAGRIVRRVVPAAS
ncbi:hypothetical protein [Nakamurella leprariae]|uniref:Uncharacterized protein n=1 Tax=Nakamurella leprariae TaxID=2803911 RepID=A0A938Y5W6_9ACTN|nr:hypothetical protein [Nakamurella leprariae]MBM9466621.1 hypothetical protein [Nakamurella leprariae]